MRAAAGIIFSLLLATTSTLADDSVTVWLTNGSMVRGELVERVPGEHVTIKLATGEVRRIEWKDIDHDSLTKKKSEPKPEPEPEPDPGAVEDAHKPNAKAKAVSDYVPPDVSSHSESGGGAVVTGADGYFLQRLEATFSGYGRLTGGGTVSVSGEAWKTECVAPCNQSVPPGTYRIDGDGIPASRTFTLRGYERVEVSPGNSAGYYGGRMLTAIGAGALIGGGIVFATVDEPSSITKTFLIGGAACFVVGLPLWILSRTTVEVKAPGGVAIRPNGIVF